MTRKVKWLLLGMLVVVSTAVADRVPAFYKTVRLSPREVLISCKEDASPKVDVKGEFVVVSCPAP
jgi:hypothetical protein